MSWGPSGDIQRVKRSIGIFQREIAREHIRGYSFHGKINRGVFTSNLRPFRPSSSRRDSSYSSFYTHRFHDFRFTGWPIGEVKKYSYNDWTSFPMPKGLILLKSGQVALCHTGIFGLPPELQPEPFAWDYEIEVPSRRHTIECGYFDSETFPKEIGSITLQDFAVAIDERDVIVNADFLEETMEMVLDAGNS